MSIECNYKNIPINTLKINNTYIVRHRDLAEIIKNERFEYKYKLIYSSENHTAVECKMTIPTTKQYVKEIGEVTKDTIFTKHTSTYPITYAYQRAFDKAAINLLGFKNNANIISDSEWNPEKMKVEEKKSEKNTTENKNTEIPDDMIILFGKCKGKKYGDVKDSKEFKDFLKWVSERDISFADERKEQVALFKNLAKE